MDTPSIVEHYCLLLLISQDFIFSDYPQQFTSSEAQLNMSMCDSLNVKVVILIFSFHPCVFGKLLASIQLSSAVRKVTLRVMSWRIIEQEIHLVGNM